MSKKLNATFIVNSDFEEHNLRKTLDSLGAKYINTLPDTEHLKDDELFISLSKEKKKNDKILYDYIDSKRK